MKNVLAKEKKLRLNIKVKLNSKKVGVLVVENIEGENKITIWIATAPEWGKANQAIIKILAKYFGVAKGKVEIIQGEKSRIKQLVINGIG